MTHQKTHWIKALALVALCSTSSLAAPPDLTSTGAIAALKSDSNATPAYGDTYNLGATGLRGWIWIDRSNKGDTGLITDLSRQILVTHVDAPAGDVLAVDDVILGAIAASSGTVPDFTSDCRKAFATAITDAEKTGAGTLRVKRWRAGVTTEQNITLPILGNYSTTAPFSCPKSSLILDNVRNKMVADLLANPNYLTGGFSGSANALALLSGVKPLDPNYSEVQARLQSFARSLADVGPINESLSIWSWSYSLIFLSEYYLITTDSQVVPGIQSFTLKLAQSQSIYGTYGHGAAATRPDGSGRMYSTGYGPVNAVGGAAAIALVIGKKALVAAGQAIDPLIDTAIQRASGFFGFYVNKGGIPYGEHEPVITYHASNSKDAMPAVFFGLQTGRTAETEYFSRMSVAGWIGREYGHTGQGLGYFWTTLGAVMGGPEAASEHLKKVRWHLDLSRRTDGSFAYDGQEQYGPGTTKDNTYLGEAEYGGMTANAIYLLTYSLPLQRLYITGKNANPAYTLNSTKVASAVAAGSFRLDRNTKSISELFTAIGDYDPIVRNYASIELASRTLSGTDLTNLRNLLSSTDPNLRQGACQTLGIRQDSASLPTIVALLNDPDLWVRAKAAIATRAYSSADASVHRDSIMSSFIANATDPDVIDWSDPIQIGNGKLGNAIFGQGVNDSAPANDIASYTINAPKQTLLYPALRAGLKQPDSYARLSATLFCRLNLPLVDAQAVYPEVANAAEFDTPADRMWSGACRHDAITMLAELKIAEGIPLALAILESAPGFEWGEGYPRIGALNALATYGEAARYTLPTLRAHQNQWSPSAEEYPVLVNTINTIENAITAPAQELGLCVANPQVVTTTGTTAITLTGASPRGPFTYLNVTQPAHGTITGTAPNLTYTPTGGYTGPDQFTFQTTDTLTTSTVATVGIVVGPSGNGLQGEYFNTANFTSLVRTRTDSQINFDWGAGTPDPTIDADTFSVRWSGVLLVPQSGNYTFSALTSDGVRLYINGNLVIDRFVDQSTRWTDSSSVYLTAGQYADIYVEYYENTGDAVAKLKWTGPGFAGPNGDFIPQAYLFDGSGMSNRPAYAFPQSLLTNQNTPLPVALNGSGGTLSYTILSQPTNGTLSGTTPNLTYTPNTNFSGTDSFTFLVNNGTTNSLPATVSINVQAGPLDSFTWTTPVSGNWNDGTKWTPGLPAAAGQPTYSLNFTSAGTYTATHNLNNGFQLNQLNTAANVTLAGTQSVSFVANGGSLPQLNQMGADEVRVSHPVSLAAMTTMGGTGGGRVILAGTISGNGGIVKNSQGILQIGQLTNSYSGGTVLNAGTVELPPGDGNLTPALGSGTITLNPGAVLSVNRNYLSNHMILNGGTITGGNSFATILSGSITLNGILNFDFEGGGFEISGNMSGQGGFTYTGPFNAWTELPCRGINTHTGPTTILSGTLSFPSVSSVPPGPLILSGDSKLKLNFTGTRVIESFTLNGVLMPPGTYGSTTSPATTKDDTHFSGNGTITVLQPTTTSLNLTSGNLPANPGTSLTFTATVTGSSPTGDVEFYSGNTLLGTSALSGSYQATLTTNNLTVGSNSITARYIGNSSNSPSTSSPVAVVINSAPAAAPDFLNATPADPSINLNWTTSSGATHYYVKRSTNNGGPYTVIAYLTGTSYQDSAILNGVAYYYVVSALNAAGEGANSIQATANIGSLTATTTTVASSPVATGVYGSSVTFTATVTSSSGTPTGTVTFRSGSNVIGTATLSSGTATLVISTLSATTHSITASYAGSLDPSASSILSYQITQKPITLSGVTAANKVYDGTTAATPSGGSLTGVIGGDTVTIVPGTGTFANANTGTWSVTATGYSLSGTHAANYTLSAQPTVPNATISARPIHIIGTKTYDGTTGAPNGILTIENNVDGGNLSLVGNGTLSDKNAGTRTLTSTFATPARIQSNKGNTGNNANTAINVTLSSVPTGGNTLVAVISTRGTSSGRVSSISGGGVTWSRVSQATNTSGTTTEIWYGPNVSTGTTGITITQASLRSAVVVMEYSGLLTPASIDLDANNTGNNNAPDTGATSTTSQATELWIGGIGLTSSAPTLGSITNSFAAVDNSASTSSTATNNARVYALERIVTATGAASTGGTLSASRQWSGAIATFKTAPSLTLTGSAAANYTLTGMTSSVTVNPKPLTLSGLSASPKTYDGTTAASVTGTAALLSAQAPGSGTTSDGKPYTGDAISLSGTPTGGSFATKHVGTAKPVTGITGLTLSGAQSGNYSLVPLGTLTANINALPVTVAAVTSTKTYDGTTTSSGTPTITPALASGDTTSALSQNYLTKNAGVSNKTLIPVITIDDGNSGANYTVTLTNFTTGTITPKDITVAAVNATKTYDGTTTAPGTPTITPALVSGDTTSALSQSFATATADTNNKVIIPAVTINDGNAGNNYAVTLENFSTGTINKATATVTLGNLNQTFTNTPKSISVTTTPPGLGNTVTYDGFTSEPINAGNYAVVATVNDANYAGSAPGSLVISKANQTITFAALTPVLDNVAPFALGATASSGLTVAYASSHPGVATVSGNNITVVGIGSTTITASQAGDSNYDQATSVPQTLTVVRANPLALTGGPYKVLVGQPLALNSSASEPSHGETITAYSWDLNNDGTFGDATGATPPAVPFSALMNTWGMDQGLNTIQLRITDSSSNVSIVSTTVELVLDLVWDANGATSGQTNGAGAWLDAGKWWDGADNQTWATGSSAIFGGPNTAGGTVTLASPTTVGDFAFNTFTGTYTLGTAGQTITLNNGITMNASAGAVTISSPITLGGAQTWTNNSVNTLTISGTLGNGGHTLTVDGSGFTNFTTALAAGVGGITKNGAGRMQLNNATQLYTGPTIVNGGVLSYGDNSGQLPAANISLNGGVIDQRWTTIFTRALGASDNQIQIIGGASGFSNNNGNHTVRINNNAATEMVWGAANEAGNGLATGFFNPSTFVLQSAYTQNNTTLTFDNPIDLNGTTRTIQVNPGIGGASIGLIAQAIRTSSGTAGIIKTGGGILALGGANSYTGDTTISSGTLRIGNNTAGTLGNGNYAGNISIASGGNLQIWSTSNQTLSGIISGAGGLQKAYGGTLTLSGPNTYTGRTSFLPESTAGFTVNITSFNSVNGGTPLMVTSSLGAPTTVPNGTIDMGNTTKQAGVNLTYTGPGETTDRVINFGFNGGASQTLTASGSGLLKFTSEMTGNTIISQSGKLNLGGTGSGEITQALPALPSGGLSKNDSGTWILGGANSYTGPTAIAAGKLLINGDQSSATGNVTVAANATLGGTGTLGGHTTIATGGKLEFNLNTAAASHNPLDLATGKDFTFSGTSTLTITSSGGAEPGIYTLITGGNNLIGSAPATLFLPSGWAATVSISGNNLLLNVTSTGIYTVTYNSNGATSGMVPSYQTKNHDVTLTIATNSGNLARTGHTFAGWNTQANGSGTSYAEGASYTANAAVMLFAQWTMLPYTSWAGTFGGTFTDTALTSNPDGDSLTNLQEFAFGMDPVSPTLTPLTYSPVGTANPGLPILENTGTTQSPSYRAVFARRKDYQTAGLTYTVEFSANLTYWKSYATNHLDPTSGTSPTAVEAVAIPFPPTVPLSAAVGSPEAATKFFRVAVTEN